MSSVFQQGTFAISLWSIRYGKTRNCVRLCQIDRMKVSFWPDQTERTDIVTNNQREQQILNSPNFNNNRQTRHLNSNSANKRKKSRSKIKMTPLVKVKTAIIPVIIMQIPLAKLLSKLMLITLRLMVLLSLAKLPSNLLPKLLLMTKLVPIINIAEETAEVPLSECSTR